MKYATCQEIVTQRVARPTYNTRDESGAIQKNYPQTIRETVRVKCGLPSAPGKNGLCADCENRIHERNEQHAEALEMNDHWNYLMGEDQAYTNGAAHELALAMDADPLRGKDGGYGPDTNWGAYLRRCEKARCEKARFDMASNGRAW
jgi:hypothetical protein